MTSETPSGAKLVLGGGGTLVKSKPVSKGLSKSSVGESVEPSKIKTLDDSPISVEIFGKYDYGKTHFAETFPAPAHIDTEGKADIVMRKLGNTKWFPVKVFQDIRNAVYTCVKDDSVKTIVIDSSSDITEMAKEEWIMETGKQPVFKNDDGTIARFLYHQIYNKIDELIRMVREGEKNLVLTSRVEHRWEDGRVVEEWTERKGYKKADYQVMILIRAVKGLPDPQNPGKRKYGRFTFGLVEKNNFVGEIEGKKPYLVDLSYQGVRNELLRPWNGTVEDIVREAEAKYGPDTPKLVFN